MNSCIQQVHAKKLIPMNVYGFVFKNSLTDTGMKVAFFNPFIMIKYIIEVMAKPLKMEL